MNHKAKQVSKEVEELFGSIKLLAMDIDGVLTDGGVYTLENGIEFRRFNIKDGLGIQRVMAEDIEVVWMSSGVNEAARHRAKWLGVDEVHLGIKDKAVLLGQICDDKFISLGNVAYIGDDLTDLPILKQVGLPCAPADSIEEVQNTAKYITRTLGGHGAVREICDLLVLAASRTVPK